MTLFLTPAHCRAARGLLDWTQDDLARAAGLSRSTVRDFETGRHDLHRATEAHIVETLRRAGVRLISADEGGPGVQLRKSATMPS